MTSLMSIIMLLYIVIANCMNSYQFKKKWIQITLKNNLGDFYE